MEMCKNCPYKIEGTLCKPMKIRGVCNLEDPQKRYHDVIEVNDSEFGSRIADISFRPFHKKGGQIVGIGTIEEAVELRDALTDFIISKQMNS